jgi:hypothetical protein
VDKKEGLISIKYFLYPYVGTLMTSNEVVTCSSYAKLCAIPNRNSGAEPEKERQVLLHFVAHRLPLAA